MTNDLNTFLSECRLRLEKAAPIDCWGGFVMGNEYLLPATKDMLSAAPSDLKLLLEIVSLLEFTLRQIDLSQPTMSFHVIAKVKSDIDALIKKHRGVE